MDRTINGQFDSIEVDPIGVVNVAGTQVNPATEDTLASVSKEVTLQDILKAIVTLISRKGFPDTTGRDRVLVDTSSSLAAVSSLTQAAGLNLTPLWFSQVNAPALASYNSIATV